jgi:hypothetical protein
MTGRKGDPVLRIMMAVALAMAVFALVYGIPVVQRYYLMAVKQCTPGSHAVWDADHHRADCGDTFTAGVTTRR